MHSLQLLPASASLVFRPDASQPTEALVFLLDGQEYGIALHCVQEIRSYQAPTRLAGACDYLLGVMDLRGEVVPLIDLRRRLGLRAAEVDAFTVVIVISLGEHRIGVVADRVNDVVELTPEQIRPMPAMKGGADQRHFVAIASIDQRAVVLMDVESLLADIQGDAQADAPLALAA
ncbi:MAG: purine-binding chemotaxis protein CheW [Burkholderiales bacterium]|nr:purine-binding chemotaxis protein CheW [Burkholderiales bacterium]